MTVNHSLRRPVELLARIAVATPAAVIVAVLTALVVPPTAGAGPEDCDETLLYLYDPHDLVWDTDLPVDLITLMDVEGLVDDYTARIDETLDAEYEDLEPPEGVSSDNLITDARWEIEDTIALGRSIAGCDD